MFCCSDHEVGAVGYLTFAWHTFHSTSLLVSPLFVQESWDPKKFLLRKSLTNDIRIVPLHSSLANLGEEEVNSCAIECYCVSSSTGTVFLLSLAVQGPVIVWKFSWSDSDKSFFSGKPFMTVKKCCKNFTFPSKLLFFEFGGGIHGSWVWLWKIKAKPKEKGKLKWN